MNNSLGSIFIKNLLHKYFENIVNKYTNFFQNNFYDTKNILKKEMSRLDSEVNHENISNFADEVSDYFVFSVVDNHISVGPYKSDLVANLRFKRPSFMKDIVRLVNCILINF